MTEFVLIGLAAAMVLVLWKSRYNYLALDVIGEAVAARTPDVTVVIPARNEAHQIERAVKSFSGVRVIVVDDHSEDATATHARKAGAEVIAAPALGHGALGKPTACAAGARLATTKWLLFVDADTWFESSFPASLIAYAEAKHAQIVSVFLEQCYKSWTEKVLLPYAFALYFTGVSARRVNDAQSQEALANGQCLLFERSAYEGMGGHTAVADSVIEDVALARRAKLLGLSLRVVRAERLGHVRMYDGLVSIWRGFRKNSFRFLLVNPWTGIQVGVASLLLTSWLPGLLWGAADYPRAVGFGAMFAPTPAILLFLAPFLALWPWYRGRHVLLAPLAIYAFQAIALDAMWITLSRQRTEWKGRDV
jgi:chlorobactene glucosyltransferase